MSHGPLSLCSAHTAAAADVKDERASSPRSEARSIISSDVSGFRASLVSSHRAQTDWTHFPATNAGLRCGIGEYYERTLPVLAYVRFVQATPEKSN